jgi:hypothetical protein
MKLYHCFVVRSVSPMLFSCNNQTVELSLFIFYNCWFIISIFSINLRQFSLYEHTQIFVKFAWWNHVLSIIYYLIYLMKIRFEHLFWTSRFCHLLTINNRDTPLTSLLHHFHRNDCIASYRQFIAQLWRVTICPVTSLLLTNGHRQKSASY